jgi:pantothenate kinase
VALEHIDPYPWFLNKSLDLTVNEQLVRTRITASAWVDSWRLLLARIHDLWLGQFPKRYLVAIAGPPGAGKSIFAEQLHFMIDRGVFHKDAHSIALPMDGFHFSNVYLKNHRRRLPDGTEIRLSEVKGQPDTIDVWRFRRHLQALIDRPEYVTWPAYSRYVHDVVPDKYVIHMSINLIFVEGNYLMVNRGPFVGIPEMFDLRIYVDAPAPKIMAALVDRHIQSGKTLEEAKDWVKRIDLPNARLAESSRHQADVIIERDTDDDIASITWKGEEPILSSKISPMEMERQPVPATPSTPQPTPTPQDVASPASEHPITPPAPAVPPILEAPPEPPR